MEKFISGKNIILRDIEINDAAFILSLRLDENKNRFLHKVDNDLSKQVDYITKYKESKGSWYFIIESKSGERLGTVRIYDVQGDSFCWGSWIIIDSAPITTAFESAIMIYEYAFYKLGFSRSHFDVRKGNKRVQAFHERMGALKIGETELDILYNFTKQHYEKTRDKYKRFIN